MPSLKEKIQAQQDHEKDLALRSAVAQAFRRNEQDGITANTMRKAAETKLKLETGFFKGDERWNSRSKAIIDQEFEAQTDNPPIAEARRPSLQSPLSPKSPGINGLKRPVLAKSEPPPVNSPPKRKISQAEEAPTRKKRKTGTEEEHSAPAKSSKEPRRRKSAIVSSDDESGTSKPTPKKQKVNGNEGLREDPDNDAEDTPKKTKSPPVKAPTPNQDPHDSSSEMSVLDESYPPPKRKRKQSGDADDPAKKPKARRGRPSSANGKPSSANDEEIKRLQKQLLQCGVRKIWGKILKPYDTDKAKIKYLKSMLHDVGITGRFSVEKAKQIKEERELQADLEAINEGNEKWGRDESADEGGAVKFRKRAPLKNLMEMEMFDDEESD